jgi:hypothetical protein
MIFSENRTNKQVPSRPRVQNISTSTNKQTTANASNRLQLNMFARLQNVTKCKNCGK